MNNYGYSIRNSWENYKIDDNLVIVEQNFTRFLKDSSVMGPEERTASYILRKSEGKFNPPEILESSSADFLFKCLFEAGFCNQPISINKSDGLVLKNLYLTSALNCVPPGDKPTSLELKTCFKFFLQTS